MLIFVFCSIVIKLEFPCFKNYCQISIPILSTFQVKNVSTTVYMYYMYFYCFKDRSILNLETIVNTDVFHIQKKL